MTKLNTPTELNTDFVIEVMHNNNPQTTSSYHYETFEKALQHYSKIEDSEAFTALSVYITVKRNGAEDFKKLILAKNQ